MISKYKVICKFYFTEPDASPQNVTAMAVSSTEIRVCWDQVPPINRNGEITMYEVQYDPLQTFDGQISTETTNTSLMCTDLTGLEEYVEYNISVRAYTSEGPGPYSLGIVETTLTDGKRHMLDIFYSSLHSSLYLSPEPSDPPQNVTATVISSTEVMVSWEEVPAIHQNGEITTYEIEYVPLETFGEQISTNTVNTSNGTMLMMVLTGLEESVEYNISVRAYTSAGPGPYSNPVTERTDTDSKEAFIYV